MDPGNSIFKAVGAFLGGLRRSRAWAEPRPWLAPLAPCYGLAARLHRAWMERSAPRGPAPRIPLVVVGALRAGGSGKTSVAEALAGRYRDRGLRVAVLAYRLGPGPAGAAPGDLLEVGSGDPWRESSEEAVLLARRLAGVRVFATRRRAIAWRSLEAQGGFDLVVSDDGYQDPRLEGAFRILLRAPGERPGPFDLLPAGPFRETARAASRADLILEGPFSQSDMQVTGNRKGTFRFRRRVFPPPGLDPSLPCAVLCGLGDNRRFLADLAALGFRPREALEVGDHGDFPPRRVEALARRHPGAALICTRKDMERLDPGLVRRLGVRAADQEISLEAGAWAAVDAYLADFPRKTASSDVSTVR